MMTEDQVWEHFTPELGVRSPNGGVVPLVDVLPPPFNEWQIFVRLVAKDVQEPRDGRRIDPESE